MKKTIALMIMLITIATNTNSKTNVNQQDMAYKIATAIGNKDFGDCVDDLNYSIVITTIKDGKITHGGNYEKKAAVKIMNNLLSVIKFDKVNVIPGETSSEDHGYYITLTSKDKTIKTTNISIVVENNKISQITLER